MTVSWFGPKIQAAYSLSVVPQNQCEYEDGAGHTLRSSGLLCMEASRDRVSQSGFKIIRGTTVGGARGTVIDVT
jgi:hypothetical protein